MVQYKFFVLIHGKHAIFVLFSLHVDNHSGVDLVSIFLALSGWPNATKELTVVKEAKYNAKGLNRNRSSAVIKLIQLRYRALK